MARADRSSTDASGLDHLPLVSCAVMVKDLRVCPKAPTLEREGFALVRHRSSVAGLFDADGRALYRREPEPLVRGLKRRGPRGGLH